MKRVQGASVAVVLALSLLLASHASAQSVFVGGGATIPSGDYGDYAKTGWMAFGGVLFPVGTAGLSVGAEGFYGSNSHDNEGDKTNLYGGLALVGYSFNTGSSATPFVYGGAGIMSHSYKSDDFPDEEGSVSDFAWSLGGGVGFPLGGVRGMAAASYNSGTGDISGTDFIGISAAVQIPFGGS